MIDHPELLKIYDWFRNRVVLPGLYREEAGGLVRHVSDSGEGVIVYSDLNEATADEVIQAQVEDFRQRGAVLEWIVYAHDLPSDLGERLEWAGFVQERRETILLLDMDAYPPATYPVPEGCQVIQAKTEADLLAAASIRQQIWGGEAGAIAQTLARKLAEQPQMVSLYLAFVDGNPVGTGQVTFYPQLRFASVGSAATLPAFRRRGLYSALLAARLEEARRRGTRYVDTEASPMSRPILEQFGFRPISTATTYCWAQK